MNATGCRGWTAAGRQWVSCVRIQEKGPKNPTHQESTVPSKRASPHLQNLVPVSRNGQHAAQLMREAARAQLHLYHKTQVSRKTEKKIPILRSDCTYGKAQIWREEGTEMRERSRAGILASLTTWRWWRPPQRVSKTLC